MGSGASRMVSCCIRPLRKNNGVSADEGSGRGFQFSEPLDEGLGHSFCYVRPTPLGGYSPLNATDKSEELSLFNSRVKQIVASAEDAEEPDIDVGDLTVAFPKGDGDNFYDEKSWPHLGDKSRLPSEKLSRNGIIEKAKVAPETTFKAISGASVSANTATPRSVISCEQFNSFSNVLYDRAAAFESTSSFSAIPLQPVPRGFSGSLSGPLDRGFMSGPLERERGFMSGPLERGFMSGPLERGSMSGPLDALADRSHFSAPLNGPYQYNSYLRKRKRSLVRIMANMSGPMKKALAKTASSIARTHRSIVAPVKNYILTKENSKEFSDVSKDKHGHRKGIVDSIDTSVEFSSSELDLREADKLQWAQGKAGEDRVHVVLSEEHGWLFVGIYDGFNGPDAPDFLMSNLYPAVFQELKGLLWNPKDEDCDVPQGNPGWVSESCETDLHDKDNTEHVSNDFEMRQGMDTFSDKTQLMDKVSQTGGSEISDLDLNDTEDKHGGMDAEKPGLAIGGNDLSLKEICVAGRGNRQSQADTEIKDTFFRHCSKLGEEQACSLVEDDSQGDSEQDISHLDAEGGVAGRKVRLSAEREGKLVEDMGNGLVDEFVIERSSDHPHPFEVSSASDQDHKLNKKRRSSRFRMRHGKRKEEFHQYFDWRYGWDQDMPGAVVQKVKNAKVAQEPDVQGNGKTVDHCCVLNALARALETTENAYLDMADNVLFENPELALMGSCVLVMIMKDEDMYILNVGDSRAIVAQNPKVEPPSGVLGKGARNGFHGNDSGTRDSLLRLELERIIEETPLELEALGEAYENGSVGSPLTCGPSLLGALQLTTDHSTNIEEEVLRLKAEHPDDDIFDNDRVKGKLKVTRAFGAGFLKQPKWNDALLEMFQINFIGNTPYITCSPALYHHRLGPRDQFLVLSSDGLYQYLSNEEVVSHVESFMKNFPDGDPAQHLIEELLFRAAKKAGMDFHELLDIPQGDRRKYHDDVSVMVISLEGRIWRSSG